MTEPQLLIDQAERLIDGSALLACDLDVGECQELQDLILLPPDAAELILRPTAGG